MPHPVQPTKPARTQGEKVGTKEMSENKNKNKALAYWAKVEDTSERSLRAVAKKFGLKFSTVIPDNQPNAAGHAQALKAAGLVGLSAEQEDGLGWATFFFYA